ncbi:hypothetical protein N9D99_08790 [Gammaproteobacteria bacterium]|nr:hypothetical protein [Gammaproteobacteria bacterium]
MITESTILIDDFEDEVLSLLKSFNRIGWGKTKQNLREELKSLLNENNYISFHANYTGYLVTTVGSSYLYDVPLYKRGHLSSFRGKRVRIVCIQSGSWRFGYMAGVVCDTPEDKIIVSRCQPEKIYKFPSYVMAHRILYKSPRFMVFEPDNSICIFSRNEPCGFIDTSGWDSILIDGKVGQPVAILHHNPDGSIRGKRTGGYWIEKVYTSLREAIGELKYY